MNDLDQQVREALDAVVSVAPPPVAVEAMRSRYTPAPTRSKLRRWRLALAFPVAAALAWFVVVNVIPSTDSDPAPAIELETVDRPPLNEQAPQPDRPPPEERLTATEGRWLSELVPSIASQLPGISQEQLWTALESAEPQPPFSVGQPGVATGVAGLPNSRLRWEGLLFPSTYSISQNADAAVVVARMHDEFIRVTQELGYEESSQRLGLSPYEVVVVASLVEAEAFNDDDRGKVARVIYNRLAEELRLSFDTPYIYAAQDRQLEFTQALLEMPGPYGLRTKTGLPPTPISAPSRASLDAAINPTEGSWLFYTFGDDQGNLHFATTLAKHRANVEAARSQGLFD